MAKVAARRRVGASRSPFSPSPRRWTTPWSASSAQLSLTGAPASTSGLRLRATTRERFPRLPRSSFGWSRNS
eukprot:3773287-Alexandrium_andersonii.AAC.1